MKERVLFEYWKKCAAVHLFGVHSLCRVMGLYMFWGPHSSPNGVRNII